MTFTRQETIDYLNEARDNMGSREFMTNADRVDAMAKFLGTLYLYCPDDLRMIVYGTIDELMMRQTYTVFLNRG